MVYPLKCELCRESPRAAMGSLCGGCLALFRCQTATPAPVLKARWSMLPWAGLAVVVDMLTATAEIKGDDGTNDPWRSVTPEYHFDAACRHLAAYGAGQRRDPQTGKHPLAHAAARLLFFLALDSAATTEVDDD